MPKVSDLKQSKYLTREDVGRGVLLTIKGYEQVNVALETQVPDMKWALIFSEEPKPLILNQVNGTVIASFTGSDDFDDWIGKQVVLYDDPTVMFGGKAVGGIRVRAPKGAAAQSKSEDDLPF